MPFFCLLTFAFRVDGSGIAVSVKCPGLLSIVCLSLPAVGSWEVSGKED